MITQMQPNLTGTLQASVPLITLRTHPKTYMISHAGRFCPGAETGRCQLNLVFCLLNQVVQPLGRLFFFAVTAQIVFQQAGEFFDQFPRIGCRT